MKKHLIFLLMATALLLVLGQCKKQEDDFDYVHITLKVADNSKHNVFTSTGAVTYSDGDIMYVANNGKYVGYLNYGGGVFSGDIARAYCSESDYLHFYFLGGKGPNPDGLEVGTTASLTAVISDQSSTLPVISYGHSDRKFNNGPATYTCILDNQCALVKFIVTTPSTAAICITGMNNRVSVNLNASNEDERFIFDQVNGGLIKMAPKDASNVTWAILLPQASVPAGDAYTADGMYFGAYPAIPGGIAANQFLNIGISMTVNTTPVEIPLTFEAKEAGATVTFDICTSAATNPVYISTDGENWSAYTSGTAIPLTNVGDKVSFRGNNARYATADKYSYFSCNEDCYIYGNVMSLINSTDYANTKVLTQNHALRELFYNNTHIVNHSSKTLVLPATTLTPWCYYRMFGNCTGLKTAPALPATNLAENCYMHMFSSCTSLETAPDLPATTLAVYCYEHMFYKCSGLTTAPAELPATTLANSCYQSMFESCTGLKTAPELPATNLAENCYMYMFSFCTSLEEAPALPATTLVTNCYNTMFKGCTSLTKAPTLPATTLASYCYYEMFRDCSNLNYVTCLATSGINSNRSTYYWLYNVASSGTFTKNASTPTGSTGTSGQYWKTNSANGIPSDWTVQDAP